MITEQTTTPTLGENTELKRYKPSQKEYWKRYGELVQRDGEKCAIPEGPHQGKLEIDHVDGRIDTWILEKQRLLCVHHNRVLQRHSAKTPIQKTERERENEPSSWESKRSLETDEPLELECRRLLAESAMPGAKWIPTVKNMTDRLAKIVGLKQQAVTRFIDRELQPEGFLMTSERIVSDGRRKRTAQILGLKPVQEGQK